MTMKEAMKMKICHNKKAFSLIEILLAIVIGTFALLTITRLFGISGMGAAKSKWVFLATAVAQSELSALDMQVKSSGGWSALEEGTTEPWDLSAYGEEIDEKFNAKVIVEDFTLKGKRYKKVIMVMGWTDFMPNGEEMEHKLPFGTILYRVFDTHKGEEEI